MKDKIKEIMKELQTSNWHSPEDVDEFFKKSLKEMYALGVQDCIDALPKKKYKNPNVSTMSSLDGYNMCREDAIKSLTQLKND